jgi:hypothetical protein
MNTKFSKGVLNIRFVTDTLALPSLQHHGPKTFNSCNICSVTDTDMSLLPRLKRLFYHATENCTVCNVSSLTDPRHSPYLQHLLLSRNQGFHPASNICSVTDPKLSPCLKYLFCHWPKTFTALPAFVLSRTQGFSPCLKHLFCHGPNSFILPPFFLIWTQEFTSIIFVLPKYCKILYGIIRKTTERLHRFKLILRLS